MMGDMTDSGSYYDVLVDGGIVVRLCFDWLERSWRIDGVYD